MVYSIDEKQQTESVEMWPIFIHKKRSTYRGTKTRRIGSNSLPFHVVAIDKVECPHFGPRKRERTLGERIQLMSRKASCSVP